MLLLRPSRVPPILVGGLSLALCILVDAACARPVVTVRPHYPGRGLDSLTQIIWSQSLEFQREMEKRGWVEEDSQAVRLMDRILLASGEMDTTHFDYRARLLRSNSLNAFACPNGGIYFHSAMVCFIDDEAELASILGHELQHVLLQHARSSASLDSLNRKRKTLRSMTLGLSDLKKKLQRHETAYSRGQEAEADSLGLQWLKREGYDPSALLRLWSRMDSLSIDLEGDAYELRADHKSDSERLEDFRRQMGEGDSGQAFKHTSPEEFRTLQLRLMPLTIRDICGQIEEELDEARPDTAGASPYLDLLMARARQLHVSDDTLHTLALMRDLALHGLKDSTLDRVEEHLAQAVVERPGDQDRALLHADALLRLERQVEALAIYRRLEADPAYLGRKGVLRIRIQRLEKLIKEKSPDVPK